MARKPFSDESDFSDAADAGAPEVGTNESISSEGDTLTGAPQTDSAPAAANVFLDAGAADLFAKFSADRRKELADAVGKVDAAAAAAAAQGREVVLSVTLRRTRAGAVSAVIAGAGVHPVTISAA